MLKVVIFDSGWGGELFADYLEKQLPVVEVIRVIDWRSGVYEEKSVGEVQKCTEKALRPYIGKVDAIVMTSMAANLNAANFMSNKYPDQKFISFSIALEEIKAQRKAKVLALGTKSLAENPRMETLIMRMKNLKVKRKDLTSWLKLIDDGELRDEEIKKELSGINDFDIVTIECPHFMDIRTQIEDLCGWRTEVLDPFEATFKRVCTVLKLRGENYAAN